MHASVSHIGTDSALSALFVSPHNNNNVFATSCVVVRLHEHLQHHQFVCADCSSIATRIERHTSSPISSSSVRSLLNDDAIQLALRERSSLHAIAETFNYVASKHDHPGLSLFLLMLVRYIDWSVGRKSTLVPETVRSMSSSLFSLGVSRYAKTRHLLWPLSLPSVSSLRQWTGRRTMKNHMGSISLSLFPLCLINTGTASFLRSFDTFVKSNCPQDVPGSFV